MDYYDYHSFLIPFLFFLQLIIGSSLNFAQFSVSITNSSFNHSTDLPLQSALPTPLPELLGYLPPYYLPVPTLICLQSTLIWQPVILLKCKPIISLLQWSEMPVTEKPVTTVTYKALHSISPALELSDLISYCCCCISPSHFSTPTGSSLCLEISSARQPHDEFPNFPRSWLTCRCTTRPLLTVLF